MTTSINRPVSFATNLKHLVFLVVLFMLGLGIIYGLTERMVVRKILTAFAMPVGICWLGLTVVSYFSFVNGRRLTGLLCLFLTMFLYLAASPIVQLALARSLEEPFREFRVETAENYDVVVVLGGGASYGYNREPQLACSGDRIRVALQLYATGKTDRIVCTGSSFADANEPSGAEKGRWLLTECGVPESRIDTLEGRTTFEEMQSLSEKYSNSDLRIGMITSAWHLPRALRLASTKGLCPEPIPANFATDPRPINVLSFIPSSGSLDGNSKLFKEYLARLVGQ